MSTASQKRGIDMEKRPLSEQLEILAGVVRLIHDELPSDIDGDDSITAWRLNFARDVLKLASKELKQDGK